MSGFNDLMRSSGAIFLALGLALLLLSAILKKIRKGTPYIPRRKSSSDFSNVALGRDANAVLCPPGMTAAQVNPPKGALLSAEITTQLSEFIRSGEKLRAIKTLRENSKLSLIDAERIIDTFPLESPKNYPHHPGLFLKIPGFQVQTEYSVSEILASLPQNVITQINALLAADKNVQAIKALRVQTNMSLIDAKTAIDTWPY